MGVSEQYEQRSTAGGPPEWLTDDFKARSKAILDLFPKSDAGEQNPRDILITLAFTSLAVAVSVGVPIQDVGKAVRSVVSLVESETTAELSVAWSKIQLALFMGEAQAQKEGVV